MNAEAMLASVLAEVQALRSEVTGLRASLAARLNGTAPPPPPRLLSKRAAAKLLGVDRGSTLGDLLATGNLRTVTLGGRPRIPLAEVERLAAEGTTRTGRKPHRRRAPGGGEGEVGKILALRRSIAA
jgi:hypothetical protein